MSELNKELDRYGVVDKSEIISDFEQHFLAGEANGQTEREVCAKLGSIEEIAKQYVDDDVIAAMAEKEKAAENINAQTQTTENSAFGENYQQNNTAAYAQPQKKSAFSAEGLIICLVIDVFLLSWAVPSLGSVIVAYCAIPVSLVATGIATFVVGIVNIFVEVSTFISQFVPAGTILLGIALTALGGLLALLGVVMIKGFVSVIKCIVNWHGKSIVGREIFFDEKVKAGAAA